MRVVKRIIVLAFLLCFIAGIFLSESFLVIHANHQHDHNGIDGNCAACAQIQNYDNIIKQIKTSGDATAFMFVNLFAAIAFLYCVSFLFESNTLFKLKIKLNN